MLAVIAALCQVRGDHLPMTGAGLSFGIHQTGLQWQGPQAFGQDLARGGKHALITMAPILTAHAHIAQFGERHRGNVMRGRHALHACGVQARFGDAHTDTIGTQASIHHARDAVLVQKFQDVLQGTAL
jgi:hypothetical protein